jgi:ferric-dicitrate binding protein FerR (iron transport regulator)
MKRFFLFFFALLIGIALYAGYKTYSVKPKPVTKKPALKASAFSIERAPEVSLLGVMKELSGYVAVQSRIATESAKIIAPVPLQQGELVETGSDGRVTVQLPGAADAMLSPDSSLELVQTIPAAMLLRQEAGSISYAKNGTIPVSIRSMHLLTKLTDGVATVSANQDDQTVTIAVTSGSITVAFNDSDSVTNALTIHAGDQYVFDDSLREGTVKALKEEY